MRVSWGGLREVDYFMPAAKMVKYCFIISTVSWSGMLQREEGNDHQFCACQLECLAEADDFFSRTKFTNAGFTGECCSAVSPWEILDEAIRDWEGRAVGAEALEEHESTQVESQSGK